MHGETDNSPDEVNNGISSTSPKADLPQIILCPIPGKAGQILFHNGIINFVGTRQTSFPLIL
jgi:hypothetical protein